MTSRFSLANLKTSLSLKPDLGSLNDAQLDALKKRLAWTQRLVIVPLLGGVFIPIISTLATTVGFAGLPAGHIIFFLMIILVGPGLLIASIGLSNMLDSRQSNIERVSEMIDAERAECVALIKSNPKARALNKTAQSQGRSLRRFDLTQMREFEADRQKRKIDREFSRLTQADPLSQEAAAISINDNHRGPKTADSLSDGTRA